MLQSDRYDPSFTLKSVKSQWRGSVPNRTTKFMAASGEENCIRQLVSSEDELVQAIVRDTIYTFNTFMPLAVVTFGPVENAPFSDL